MNRKILLGAVVLLIVVVTCALIYVQLNTKADQLSASDLEGKKFQMVSINDVAVPTDARYTLEFEDGAMRAKICNTMFGNFTLQDNILKGNMASTLMACVSPDGIMEVESEFGSLVGSGATVSVSGGSLTFSHGGKTAIFVRD